jgi:hypothetical protein
MSATDKSIEAGNEFIWLDRQMEKVGNDTLDIWGFLFFFFCNTGD